eukprot:g4646.t1
MLFTIMLISISTMKAIPIAHMCMGRYTSQDICDFFKFVWNLERAWMQVFVVIDKALCEAQGIELFAGAEWHGNNNFCLFLSHVASNSQEMGRCNTQRVPCVYGFWSARWKMCNIPHDIKDFLFYTNNFIEAWHKVLKTLALRNKKNKCLDLFHMVCVERMQRICARAMHDVDLTKEWKRMFHIVDLATLRLGGDFGDGPTSTCKDPNPLLSLHIIIVYYDAQVYYTAEQSSDWGLQGNQDDRLYLTLRCMSLVLQEGEDNQEADDDNSNFDNDDNHDNSQAKTDDELKHVFKEITDGLDVLS